MQLEIFRSWTPAERLRRGMEMTQFLCRARDARLRRQHPEASEQELRELRVREVLRSKSTRLE